MLSNEASGLQRATLAVLPPIVALALQSAFWPYIDPFVWLLFYPAVFVSSLIAGRVAGIVATLLSAGLAWFFFIPPRYSFAVTSTAQIVSMLVFIGIGVAFSFLHGRLRQANRRASTALAAATSINEQLETRVQERTADLAASIESLRATEQLLRTVTEQTRAGLVMVSTEHRYLFANAAYKEMLGLGDRDIVGKRVADVLANVYDSQIRPQLERAFAGERVAYELRRVPSNDSRQERYYAVSYEPRKDGSHTQHVVVVIYDITERKRAEQALMTERTLLRTLIDALPDVVFTKDLQGRYLICNAAELKNLGVAREDEVIGKTAFDFYSRDLAERYYADDMRALQGEAVVNQEEPGVDDKGVAHWYLTIKVPLRDPAGGIIGLVGISRDITDHRRAEESLRRAQKLEALGTLAGGIAHDFNNLLLAIMGNAALATEEIAADSSAQESLAEIARAATRASDLVKRILSFSRPEEPRRQTVRLQPTVEEALKLLRSTLPAMIDIRSRFAPDAPAVVADPGQVHQVIMNLVTNAAHAVGSGVGRIDIDLEALDASPDLARATPDLHEGRYARLTVSDSGCGMNSDTLQRIFDPFFTTKRAGEGTGLGLSVVHGIMRNHGGAINVYSEPGKGTAFRLYFPAAANPDATAARMPGAGQLSGRGERILYVDDESALVQLATRMLRRLGYEVTGHTEPTQALAVFESDPQAYDVVITDLSMPGLSGFDLARKVRAVRPELPIIMTSGYVRPEDQETAQQVGVQEVILKPDTIEALGAVLSRVLRSSVQGGNREA